MFGIRRLRQAKLSWRRWRQVMGKGGCLWWWCARWTWWWTRWRRPSQAPWRACIGWLLILKQRLFTSWPTWWTWLATLSRFIFLSHYLSSWFLTGFEQHVVECKVLRSGSVRRLPHEHCRLPEPPEEGGDEGLHQVRLQDRPWQTEIDDRSIPGRTSAAPGRRCPTVEASSLWTPSTVRTATPWLSRLGCCRYV